MQTTSASAPAGVDVVCSMSLCSIKVILIYIPVRSAGGGLSSFLGMILSMEKEDCERHKGAHVHAWYQGHAAIFDARTGKMLAKGKNGFPRKQAG